MPRTSMFPFSDRISDSMQRRVVSVIQSPQFIFELPSLNTASWNMILYDGHRRERLEFLGDALIGASISEELFRCWPNEGPGFYTKARSVLTANSTFAHIMHKLGFHNMSHPVKPTGDAFETILATYHKEQGPDAFNQYVRQFFLPLVNCVGHGYHDARLQLRKARMQHHDKLSSTAASMRKKIKTRPKPKAHNKLVNVKNNIQKRSLQPQCVISQHEIPRRFAAPMSNISTIANAPVVVDLTLDNESDDPISEVQPPSASAPKPSSSSRNPRGSYNRVWSRPVTPPVNDHMSILKTISESPKVKKSTGILPAAPFVNSSRNFTLPATLLTQASPSFKLGSINNPITID